LVGRFHHAVGQFPRLRGFPSPGRAGHVKRPVHPLFEFRSPPECCPTQPSLPAEPTSTSHGLPLPAALAGSEVHLLRALPAPATVRPQGLVTLSTAYALRAPADFVSHRRRSWDSPFGAFSSRKVTATFPGGRTHIPFNPSVIPPPQGRWAGPTGRGFWALALSRVPGDRRGLARRPLDAPMGFALLGLLNGNLARDFARAPPARFANVRLTVRAGGHHGVSIGLRLVPPAHSVTRVDGRNSPFRVLAPVISRTLKRGRHLGYWVHLVPRRALLPIAGTP